MNISGQAVTYDVDTMLSRWRFTNVLEALGPTAVYEAEFHFPEKKNISTLPKRPRNTVYGFLTPGEEAVFVFSCLGQNGFCQRTRPRFE